MSLWSLFVRSLPQQKTEEPVPEPRDWVQHVVSLLRRLYTPRVVALVATTLFASVLYAILKRKKQLEHTVAAVGPVIKDITLNDMLTLLKVCTRPISW